MAEVEARELDVAGVRTLVRTAGPADGSDAIVFVHGNPGSSEDFEELLPHAGDIARVVAPDMPGFGRSERARHFRYTIDGFAAHLNAIVERLGIARAHLVLHDFGGPWGLAWAAAHPDRVASLVLINVGVLPGYGYHKYAWLWRTPIVGSLSIYCTTRTIFKTALNRDNPKPLPNRVLDRMYAQWDRGTRRAVLALYRAESAQAASSLSAGETLRPRALPALVVWGVGDPNIPVRYAAAQSMFFDATIHTLDGAGHWPMIDEPERTRELVLPFLRRHAGSADQK